VRRASVRDFDAGDGRGRSAMVSRDDPPAPDPERSAAAGGRPRRLKVSDLLAGEREAILEHDGQEYRLRNTANGKLILTK
jgi:hemin uptake protein HemP